MNPISIMNNDMSTFMLATQNIFEIWKDKVAGDFNTHCVEQIQRDWNSYLSQMNVQINLFMRAEKRIDEELERYEKDYDRP